MQTGEAVHPTQRRKVTRVLWVTGVILAITLTFAFSSRPKPGSFEYHYDRLLSYRNNFDIWKEPQTTRDYFRPITIRRYLAGNPTLTQYIDRQEEDQLALIRLGYFERREFNQKTSLAINHNFDRLQSAIYSAGIDQSFFLHIDDSRPAWLRVTCRRDDMPTVRRVIERFESTNAKP